MKYKNTHKAFQNEVFVLDCYLGNQSVTWFKKHKNKLIPTDKIIMCDRCEQAYARYLDPLYPVFNDFTLCDTCLRELEAIKFPNEE